MGQGEEPKEMKTEVSRTTQDKDESKTSSDQIGCCNDYASLCKVEETDVKGDQRKPCMVAI